MQLHKPRALRPGDRIGIVSTSSPVSAGELDRLIACLGDRGYAVQVADGVLEAPADWLPEDAPDAGSDELVLRCAKGHFPVITGVPFGHQQTKIQFPIGCRVEFDLRGEHPVLRYLEDLVSLDH